MSKRRGKKRGGKSIFDKLTDSSQYTGSHKSRFNADGTGRGAAGRDLGKMGGGSNAGWHGERFKSSAAAAPKPRRKVVKKKTTGTTGGGVRKKKVVRKKVGTGSVGTKKKVVRKKKKSSIFDKLTDASQYTGSHKSRFNADGTGRGAAGRDLGKMGGGSQNGAPW